MATTTNTLAPISGQAEILLYGQPHFSALHTATATALDAVVTPAERRPLMSDQMV